MCLILFSYDQHPKYRLILAANRDEFYERPTEPAGYWDEYPGLLAGKDVKAGGTWMGITANLRFAAITNHRDPSAEKAIAPSRGHLVLDYLKGDLSPQQYLQNLSGGAGEYNGFNLLVGDAHSLWYFSNRDGEVRAVTPGVHGLSNALLDTPWPKVEKGKARLSEIVGQQTVEQADLMTMLSDSSQAADEDLPQTGVPLEWERRLSSMFIESPNYGTRASSVLLIDHEGHVSFIERTVGPVVASVGDDADEHSGEGNGNQKKYTFKAENS